MGSLAEAWRKISYRISTRSAEVFMNRYMDKIVSDANKNAPTTRSPEHPYPRGTKIVIEKGEVRADGKRVTGELRVDLGLYPAARAIELGSGLNDEENPKYIEITPRPENEEGMLVFWWEKRGVLFKGPIVKKHPGVPPRPYIKPAIEDSGDVFINWFSQFLEDDVRVVFAEENSV